MNPSDDEAQIRELISSWLEATAAGDLPRILELLDEDVVFLLPGRPPMRGPEDFATSFRAISVHSKIEGHSDIREIRVSGDHAFCWTQLMVQVTPEDGTEPRKWAGSTLSVYRKGADGRWRLFRDANMLTEVTPPVT